MIPEFTKETIDRYVKDHCHPGGFVYAVLSNDLAEAFARADDNNSFFMKDIVSYIYNHIPINSWGSKEIVDSWLAAR